MGNKTSIAGYVLGSKEYCALKTGERRCDYMEKFSIEVGPDGNFSLVCGGRVRGGPGRHEWDLKNTFKEIIIEEVPNTFKEHIQGHYAHGIPGVSKVHFYTKETHNGLVPKRQPTPSGSLFGEFEKISFYLDDAKNWKHVAEALEAFYKSENKRGESEIETLAKFPPIKISSPPRTLSRWRESLSDSSSSSQPLLTLEAKLEAAIAAQEAKPRTCPCGNAEWRKMDETDRRTAWNHCNICMKTVEKDGPWVLGCRSCTAYYRGRKCHWNMCMDTDSQRQALECMNRGVSRAIIRSRRNHKKEVLQGPKAFSPGQVVHIYTETHIARQRHLNDISREAYGIIGEESYNPSTECGRCSGYGHISNAGRVKGRVNTGEGCPKSNIKCRYKITDGTSECPNCSGSGTVPKWSVDVKFGLTNENRGKRNETTMVLAMDMKVQKPCPECNPDGKKSLWYKPSKEQMHDPAVTAPETTPGGWLESTMSAVKSLKSLLPGTPAADEPAPKVEGAKDASESGDFRRGEAPSPCCHGAYYVEDPEFMWENRRTLNMEALKRRCATPPKAFGQSGRNLWKNTHHIFPDIHESFHDNYEEIVEEATEMLAEDNFTITEAQKHELTVKKEFYKLSTALTASLASDNNFMWSGPKNFKDNYDELLKMGISMARKRKLRLQSRESTEYVLTEHEVKQNFARILKRCERELEAERVHALEFERRRKNRGRRRCVLESLLTPSEFGQDSLSCVPSPSAARRLADTSPPALDTPTMNPVSLTLLSAGAVLGGLLCFFRCFRKRRRSPVPLLPRYNDEECI